MELPPVPRLDRILLGLRRLRRLVDVARALRRGRHGSRGGATRQRRRDHDPPLRAGGRPRLRLDGEQGVRRAAESFRGGRPAARRDAPAPSARAPRPGRAPLRRHAGRAGALRPLVRTLPLRTHHGDRPGLRQRRRGDGVPDAVHLRDASVQPSRRGFARERDGARGRTPVLVRHRRQQRVRARLDRRGAQHLLDPACPRPT